MKIKAISLGFFQPISAKFASSRSVELLVSIHIVRERLSVMQDLA